MKKLIFAFLIFATVLFAFGCNQTDIPETPETPEAPEEPVVYEGKKITRITYSVGDGLETIMTFDFERNKLDYERTRYSVKTQPTPVCDLPEELEEDFINAIYGAGLLDLDSGYYPDYSVFDSAGWVLIITYEDGTTKRTDGYHIWPEGVFDEFGAAFREYYGCDFAGKANEGDEPDLDYDIICTSDSDATAFSATASPTNVKWYKKKLSGIDPTAAANSEQIYLYDEAKTYSLTFHAPESESECRSISVISRTPDGYDRRDELTAEFAETVTLAVEPGRIYVATVEFADGYCEYPISTCVNNLDTLPDNLNISLEYGAYGISTHYDRMAVYGPNQKGMHSGSHYDLTDKQLLEVYRILRTEIFVTGTSFSSRIYGADKYENIRLSVVFGDYDLYAGIDYYTSEGDDKNPELVDGLLASLDKIAEIIDQAPAVHETSAHVKDGYVTFSWYIWVDGLYQFAVGEFIEAYPGLGDSCKWSAKSKGDEVNYIFSDTLVGVNLNMYEQFNISFPITDPELWEEGQTCYLSAYFTPAEE